MAEEPLHSDEGTLTPPHGDDLRSEETFGRTDRYSNIDDDAARREEQLPASSGQRPATEEELPPP